MYTGDITAEDQQLFVVERRAFTELCTSLIQPCTCWHTALWDLQTLFQVIVYCYAYAAGSVVYILRTSLLLKGHVLRAEFRCRRCGKVTQTWASSRFFGGHYLVNQKLVKFRFITRKHICRCVYTYMYMNNHVYRNTFQI